MIISSENFKTFTKLIQAVLVTGLISCGPSTEEKQVQLYTSHCASCHLAPEIQQLPKALWQNTVLPEMAARMGVPEPGFDPFEGLTFPEQEAIIKGGIYSVPAQISASDWVLLKEYILKTAPDSLPVTESDMNSEKLVQFQSKPIAIDNAKRSMITYLGHDSIAENIIIGDATGRLLNYNIKNDTLISKGRFGSALVDYSAKDGIEFITTVGFIDPSAIATGKIILRDSTDIKVFPENLHRPVHTLVTDLNDDGTDELVVSEYGDLVGSLSMLVKNKDGSYEKKVLLNQPGTIRVIADDLDKNGKKDLIVLTAQGDETITVLYQESDLVFSPTKVLRFSPVFGTSWFELVDYDGDGDKDIVTVHGDNADDTYVQKSYHGLRIHINNGENSFEERYFFPLNGSTRVIAKDFDNDQDVDFALLSTFPDYKSKPESSFVYLENRGSENFDFKPFTFDDSRAGKWFVMSSGDIDGDGDEDIVLGAFSKVFAPTPKELIDLWRTNNVDIMLLENNLKSR